MYTMSLSLWTARFHWKPNDPEIVSDVLFAIANVISFARTTYLMPAFEVLGPLQISLGRMIGDITRFMVLFTLVSNGIYSWVCVYLWIIMSSLNNLIKANLRYCLLNCVFDNVYWVSKNVFLQVLFAFMVGLHNLYWYYGAQRIKMVLNDKTIYVHAAEAFQGYVGEREREYSDYIIFE